MHSLLLGPDTVVRWRQRRRTHTFGTRLMTTSLVLSTKDPRALCIKNEERVAATEVTVVLEHSFQRGNVDKQEALLPLTLAAPS